MTVILVKVVACVLMLIGSYAILEALVNMDRPRPSRKARRVYR